MIRAFLRWLAGEPPLFEVWWLPRAPWGDWVRELTSSRDVAAELVRDHRRRGDLAYYQRLR